jgi:hypothetical protein
MLNSLTRNKRIKIIRMLCLALWLFALGTAISFGKEKKPDKIEETPVMTETELQSQLMAFADRFASVMGIAINKYEEQSPPPEERKAVVNVSVYSIYAAFTIAAEAKPAGSLLDMVAMVTLGRIIYEENMQAKFGPRVEPIAQGFRTAEKDIRQVAAKVLTPVQQQKLYALFDEWRKNNPGMVFFPSVRFGEFSAFRGNLGDENKESGGLFKSVENAVQQAEEARLLAERGMYLATRIPLLTGLFGGVFFSQLAKQPEIEKVLKDLNSFSEVSQRLATVAEQLPGKIATERDTTIKQAMENINALSMTTIDSIAKKVSLERKATINQLMQEISKERKIILEDFTKEEKNLRSLLTELRLTLSEGNKVIGSADSLLKDLNLGSGEVKTTTPAKPFDITDYQNTLKEASSTILQLHELVRTIDQVGIEKILPQVITAADKAEAKGKEWVFLLLSLASR